MHNNRYLNQIFFIHILFTICSCTIEYTGATFNKNYQAENVQRLKDIQEAAARREQEVYEQEINAQQYAVSTSYKYAHVESKLSAQGVSSYLFYFNLLYTMRMSMILYRLLAI